MDAHVTMATPHHAGALAAIHAAAFPLGERWDAAAFAGLLATPHIFGALDSRGGMILARSVGGEAEILTLAVIPAARRRGLGGALLRQTMTALGGVPVFLEVAAGNVAALTLYQQAGFQTCGRRVGYYGPGLDALVLRGGYGLSDVG